MLTFTAGGVLRSVQELGRALAQASSEAELVVFDEFKLTSEEYFSNVGLHSKLDPKFRKEREQVERDHRNRMVKMFKPAERHDQSSAADTTKDTTGTAENK